MPGVELVVPDILGHIMFMLPSTIEQKFAFAQVSRFWRDVALQNHLFWSSFTGRDDYHGASKADCYRLPLVLERSGSRSMLHIRFHFRNGTDWISPAEALKALVPVVSRIATLDVQIGIRMDVMALLASNLEFPALKTLRLKGSAYVITPSVLLTAPQLRTLDIKRARLLNWRALLSPSLENISVWDSTLEMFVEILKRCPRVWRVMLQSYDPWYRHSSEDPFEALVRRPLVPALRELDLRLADLDLVRVLRVAFSDVVLHTLSGCIYNGHGEDDLELLTGALLPGVGPLAFFQLVDMRDLELHDAAGHIRHLRCWNDNSSFEVEDTWRYLSVHFGLNQTVREIRLRPEYWEEYLTAFESYPPQPQDGITLGIDINWDTYLPPPDDNEDGAQTHKIMRNPGLAKVEFRDSRYTALNPEFPLETILEILANIEPPAARVVEVCISKKKLKMRDTSSTQDARAAFQTALSGNNWVFCSHCIS